MTKKQKSVILIFCLVLLAMLLFPPKYSIVEGTHINWGYRSIFKHVRLFQINTGLLAVQYVFVVTIGIGLLFFLKPKDKGGAK